MGEIGLAKENEGPEGTPIGSQYGCNRPLQANLSCEAENFEIVDKECVKPGFDDTLLIRATMRLSGCAGWLGLLCCAQRFVGVQLVRGARNRALARRGCGVPE
jgi:hypothetical protein